MVTEIKQWRELFKCRPTLVGMKQNTIKYKISTSRIKNIQYLFNTID